MALSTIPGLLLKDVQINVLETLEGVQEESEPDSAQNGARVGRQVGRLSISDNSLHVLQVHLQLIVRLKDIQPTVQVKLHSLGFVAFFVDSQTTVRPLTRRFS